jgi:hypothetical protein
MREIMRASSGVYVKLKIKKKKKKKEKKIQKAAESTFSASVEK